ncbi:phosphatidate cytidylyltransferase [Candidatus Dependentiae bacterium]|nr:phosphatidate cytidylyltransferase [Candidatus Dependentiae bacterium]
MNIVFKENILRFITSMILGGCFWIVFFYLPNTAFAYMLFGILIAILTVEWKNIFNLNNFWFWFIMPWYPILPFAMMIYMSNIPCYRTLIYYLFVIVFSFDSTAYIVGKLLGFRKIVPHISPGKTVEGFIGGFLGAFIAFYMAIRYQGVTITHHKIFIITLIVCCIAFAGDVFESFLKRQANIKDSGVILPGHGGFLDRFDAVIFAAYFFFLFRDELVKIFCIVI